MSLSESLRDAFAGTADGCPPPEVWLSLESGELPADEQRRLEEHAASCPACSAERDLARLFVAPPEEDLAARSEDVDAIVARLAALDLPNTRRPLEFPAARRKPAAFGFSGWAGRLAAALALAVGLGFYLQARPTPPVLPDPTAETVRRGADLRAVSPVGEFPAMPSEFRWEETPGASSYRVTLRAVDDEVLWQETFPGSPARLPGDVTRRLHPEVAYTWTVEALDAGGAKLAASDPARFQVTQQQR